MADASPLDAVEIKYGEQLLPIIRSAENSGDDAISHAGAVGRYQVMPATARHYGFDPSRLKDPLYNERVAGHILNDLWRRFPGDPASVLVGYNAGPTVARRWRSNGKQHGLPLETMRYLNTAENYLRVGGKPLPPIEPMRTEFVTDIPNRPTQPRVAPGASQYRSLIDGGFSQQEADQWRDNENQKLIRGGFTPGEIEAYWGNKDPDPTPLNEHIERNIAGVGEAGATKVAQNPMDMFAAGLEMSVSGLAVRGRLPETVLPEDAGIAAKTLAGAGQLVGDLPYAVAGFVGGAAVTSGTGPGALVAGGAGSAMLPQAMREIMTDYYRRGEIRTASDFMAMAGHSVLNTGKAGVAGAISAFTGLRVGGAVAPVAGKTVAGFANTGTQVATYTGVSAAMEGRLPDADDFTAAAIVATAMHVGGSMMPKTASPQKVKAVSEKMEEVYRETGIPPWDLAQKMRTDRVAKGEVLAEDPSGQPVMPNLRASMDEPAPYKAPEKIEYVTKQDGSGGAIPPKGDDATPPAGGPKQPKLEPGTPMSPEILNEIAGEFINEPVAKDNLLDPSRNYRQWISELGPARAIDTMLLDHGYDRNRQMGLEDMFRQTYASDTRTGYFVQKGALDPITLEPALRQNPETGKMVPIPSIKDAVATVRDSGGNLRDWINYMVAQRANTKETAGFETGHPLDRSQRDQLIAAGDSKYARATGQLQMLLNDGGLEYGRLSGIFSSKQVEAMQRENPVYVSFRRISGDEPPKQQRGRGFRVREPVSRFEGDDRTIRNPLLATVDNLNQIIRMADRNRAIGSVITLAERHGITEDLGLKKIEAPEIKMAVAEPGSDIFKPYDINNPNGETYAPFLAQRAIRNGGFKPNQFMYIRDGKPEIWEAHDEALATLLRGADTPGEANVILRMAQGIAAFQRTGIVNALDFPVRNSMRDQLTAFIMDPHSPTPYVTWMRGAMDVFKGGDAYWRWVGKGGAGAALVEMDLNRVERSVNEVFEKTGTYNALWNTVRHPLEAMQMLSERIDAASRLGYAKGLEANGIDSIKAATMGRKAMLDFVERGTLAFGQGWARVTPFMRPTLLGYKQFGEAITSNPGGVLLKTLAAVTVPTIVFNLLNYFQDKYGGLPEDEKFSSLPRYYKDGMYILPQVGGVRLRVPYPPVVGPLFGGMTTRFMDHFLAEDPAAFEKWGHTVLAQLIPPFIPSIVLPPLEQYANRNFFTGHPLVPASLEDASGPMQYTEATTEPAKKLSQIIHPLGANVSPIVVENYARNWAGSLGMTALKALNAPFKVEGKPWEMADIPFVGSFLIRNPGMSAQPIQDFFDARKKLTQNAADLRLAKKRTLQGYAGEGEFDEAVDDMAPTTPVDDIASDITNMQGIIIAINHDKDMTDREKLQFTDDLYGTMIEMSKAGLEITRALLAKEPEATNYFPERMR